MEALYSELYDKYNKLKTRRESVIEQFSHDQEVKFVNYISVAEELIEHLKGENDKLKVHLNELNDEADSIKSATEGQCIEYQKLFLEQSQKTTELSKEIERLQNLQREGLCCISMEGNKNNVQSDFSGGTQVRSKSISNGSLRKNPRLQHAVDQADEATQVKLPLVTDSKKDLCRGSLSDDGRQAKCCMRKTASSGFLEDCTSVECLFQTLMESLVGVKFAPVKEAEGLGLSAVHQSSGYSFSLTWVSKAAGEQVELLYQVSSLGTFERIAPEWMKEDLMFSTSMCPVFFKRVSQVIGLQC